MATSLRRNRANATDGATPKFLYTILKQLDLKSIDWNNVAGSLEITNGHAARMRFSRFRQQMEGIQPPPRKPRSAIASNKKSKKEKLKSKPKSKEENRLKREDSKPIKTESRDVLENPYSEAPIDALVSIKNEPNSEGLQNNIEAMEGIASNSHGPPKLKFEPEQESQIQTLPSECPKVKEEPSVKIEPAWD